MFEWKSWSNFDVLTFLLALCLASYGILALAGATSDDAVRQLWDRQLLWFLLGVFILIFTILLDYQALVRFAPIFYVLGLIGLILCFLPYIGHSSHGSNAWIKIGGLPQIQPSEFAKITTILMLAWVLSFQKEEWRGLWDVFKPLAVGAIPSLMVAKQPDMGTAIVFVPITLIMMFVAGLPFTYLVIILSPALSLFAISHDILMILLWFTLISAIILMIILKRVPWTLWVPFLTVSIVGYLFIFQYGPVIWEKIPDYMIDRLVGYMDPEYDLNKTNYNINQSKIALGSGGFWGKGFGEGTQSKFNFLPEFQHDFVFSALGEQMGFFGGVILLSLFLLLIVRGLDTAMESKTSQGALIASGVIAMYFSHIMINIGVVTGLLPVTGLPLTFISYGGTFMLASMIGIGLLINIRMSSQTEMVKDGFASGRPSMSLPSNVSDDF